MTFVDPYDGLMYYEVVTAPASASGTAAAIAATHAIGKGMESVGSYATSKAVKKALR